MQKSQSTVRYRVRNKKRLLRDNFFPWGLLGLLLILLPLLYALFWYAEHEIESTVKDEVAEKLASQGLGWVNVEVDGQEVLLSGVGPKRDGDKAIALAEKVTDKAWLGRFSVPSDIDGQFSQAALVNDAVEDDSNGKKPEEPSETVAEPNMAPMPVPDLSEQAAALESELGWGTMTGQLNSGVLTLVGTVGSQEEKAALIDAVNSKLSPPRLTEVVDQIVVSQDALIPASSELASRAVELISACNTGQSSSLEGVLSVQCQVDREQVENLESLANTSIDGASLGSVEISSADDCNEEFVKILDGKSIRFSIGSADLKSASTPLLDQVSDLAKSCSGVIRVEGHTDKSGSLESNMALSNARAEAVVDALVERGVQRERLRPEGFGPTRPRVEGDTQVARALNRRIEFHVSQK